MEKKHSKKVREKADDWIPHQWSEKEIAAAVAYLKKRIPQEWAELERLERTTGDLSDSHAGTVEFVELMNAYKGNFDHRDIIWLLTCVRGVRRADMGLTN